MDTHLDRPPTRFLDRLEVDRLRLLGTSVREVGAGFVVLDVSCASETTATRRAGGTELTGVPVENGSLTVRVDAVGPRTFRYRFALGADVPAGRTPMLVTDVQLHPSARTERTATGVILTTDHASIEVEVPELGGPTLRIRRADGSVVGTVGGGEANLMSASWG